MLMTEPATRTVPSASANRLMQNSPFEGRRNRPLVAKEPRIPRLGVEPVRAGNGGEAPSVTPAWAWPQPGAIEGRRAQAACRQLSSGCVHEGESGPGHRLGAGVEGDGPPGGRLCLCRRSAGGDAGLAPLFAAERDELAAVGGRHPRGAVLRVHGLAAGHVPGQAQQCQIPADAHRARPELGPQFVRDVSDMLQLQPDPPIGLLREAYLDPTALAAELPCGGEAVRRVAALDRAARVALELVAAAHPQVTGDRQEPPWDALGVGARVPEVVDGALVGLADGEHAGLARLQRPAADFSSYLADLVLDIDHDSLLLSPSDCARRRWRRPRASSVASASSGGVQNRRN